MHIDVVTNGRSVRSNNWSFTTQQADDGTRDDSTEVQIACAEKITAAGYTNGQSIRMIIRLRYEICTAFGNVIRITTLKSGIFKVRQTDMLAIGFIARSNQDSAVFSVHIASIAGSFQYSPGSLDVVA